MKTIFKGVLAAMMFAGAMYASTAPAQAYDNTRVGIYVGYGGGGYYDRYHRWQRYHRAYYAPRYCRYYHRGWYWRHYCRPYHNVRYWYRY